MNPHIATLLCLSLISALFVWNRDRSGRVSLALWLPCIWLSIGCSRMLSAWFGVGDSVESSERYIDGNPLDRAFLAVIVLVGISVLVRRRRRAMAILQRNLPIVLFLAYCALSVLWSDYMDVALKRWVKSLGDFTMVMVVLTEDDPFVAVKVWLSRVGFWLVPLSVLLVKYYPNLGRGYNRFTWTPFYQGVATDKNGLGLMCLVCGLAGVWQVVQLMKSAASFKEKRKSLLAQGILLAMVLWLLWKSNSMTSLSCFVMGSVLIICGGFRFFTRGKWAIQVVFAGLLTVTLTALFLSIGSGLVATLGRDQSLTGRTEIWKAVLSMPINPLVGTGFESFWLGERLEQLWRMYWWEPNEAHNGYIEVYLNLGWIGIMLLGFLLATGYRAAIAAFRRAPLEGGIRVAFLFVAIAYNCTESAVRIMNPAWICLLLSLVVVPGGWSRVRNEGRLMSFNARRSVSKRPAQIGAMVS